ncbi:MAG TPA: hypothetical protein PK767_06645 [Clostridiales bacterium]|jgi:hypothetical protein|nr:hypothetical protein [Bacillota bacterium]HOA56111.1 hypothetical protein [Clostridiales bacterium]HPP35906.1 hypothetical protein [Clostridiales bacterium]HPZ05234.1 hypothetical protein [Clostridiales bacterium]
MDKSVLKHALKSAEAIFLNPSVKYPYDDIIRGVQVNGTRKKAVDINTTQAFGKKLNYGNFRENKIKAMDVCDTFFLEQKEQIIKVLCTAVKSRNELDEYEHELFKELRDALLLYSTSSLINESYNRIRKVVELYLEHIVSMAAEIDDDRRKELVPMLFLPIDSWIIANELIFSDYALASWGLTRKSSFGKIYSKALFDNMQRYLSDKAQEISTELGEDFHVIYFDVFWKNRLYNPGCNLFGEQGPGNQANDMARTRRPLLTHDMNSRSPAATQPKTNDKLASYPQLLRLIMNELAELNIHIDKDYKCIMRKNGEYILEAAHPTGRRKNIVTVWPANQGGSIRIVGIGKYSEQTRFDYNDIGTDKLRSDLYTAYKKTQL